MCNVAFPNISVIKNLEITVDNQSVYSDHINAIIIKAYKRACLILHCFKSKEPSLLFRAFVTYVRPLPEYNSPMWSPRYAYLIYKLESVQHRFTKHLMGFVLMLRHQNCDVWNQTLLQSFVLLSTYADRQGVDISFTVCLCVCTDIDFSAEDKASSIIFCSAVHQHPRQRITILCKLSPQEAQNQTNRSARGPRPPACKHYHRDAPT